MWPLSPLPPPPIPQRIRELLKDYPELIETLQGSLNNVILNPSPMTPPFEVAVWALEDGLESFNSNAKKELRQARAADDAEAIALADQKERATSFARASGGGMRDLSELSRFFEKNERAFK